MCCVYVTCTQPNTSIHPRPLLTSPFKYFLLTIVHIRHTCVPAIAGSHLMLLLYHLYLLSFIVTYTLRTRKHLIQLDNTHSFLCILFSTVQCCAVLVLYHTVYLLVFLYTCIRVGVLRGCGNVWATRPQSRHWLVIAVGYTMRDIRYKWNEGPNSVGVSHEVSLPQFKVLGHRQRAMEISLTTGTALNVGGLR